MKEQTSPARQGRRGFLKGVAAAGSAATVAVAAGAVVAKSDNEEHAAESAVPQSQGYHETAHIREYYKKARI